ncbi:MAG: sodium:solute symporter family protein [Oscillospiraceae bacterium]|nr:sodium:solute symporter family protein [Oscillospiraceae bacterium]
MLQITIVVLYVIVTILVGVWSRKKAKTSKTFDGVGLGFGLCVVASAGEWMGGTSTTGVSEYGYVYGISGAWYTIANGLGICFLALFFAKLFRSLKTPTVSGIIGKYIGKKARIVSGALLLLVMATVGVSQMIALGSLGEALFGLKAAPAILILGYGVLIYTVCGGMPAVGYTNILHMVVMYGGSLLALFLCLKDVGGWTTLTDTLPKSYFSGFTIGFPKVSSWIIASVLGACTAQAGLQPILGAKDEKTAVKSSYAIAVLVAPFGIITAILGMIAKVKFPFLENPKLALSELLMTLPPMAGGVVMASIFAAILSTAAPIFLACGTIFSRDIFCELKFLNKNNADDKAILKVSRTATFVAGTVCILMSVLLNGSSTILDLVYFAYSIRGSLFIILLLGIYWKKISQSGAIVGMILTSLLGLFWIIYENIFGTYPISPYLTETYISVIAATVFTVVGSLLQKKNKQDTK